MLAYPTPTFDAKTILQAPGYRPLGRGSQLVYEEQPEASTPLNCVNRHTKNGGFTGTISKKFIQNPWKPDQYDPLKGTPLSKPGSVGNVGDQAISIPPKYAEPENGELKAILNILNGKPMLAEHVGKLSAKQVESLGRKSKRLSRVDGAIKVAKDFSDTQLLNKKETIIRKVVSQGFSLEEAKSAYAKTRIHEAELAINRDEDPSSQLYDLIDSKISGTQNGSIRGNDETGLFLAKGGNAVMVKKAESKNADMEAAISRARGRPTDEMLAAKAGTSVEEIREIRKIERTHRKLSSYPGFAKL